MQLTTQEIKYYKQLHDKYPDMALREIARRGQKRFGILRHTDTIKKAINL